MKRFIISLILLFMFFFLLYIETPYNILKNPNYNINVLNENGSLNIVSAIVLDYRFYDTFFEILVFTITIIGISYFMKFFKPNKSEFSKPSVVLKVFSPVMFPITLLLGIYNTLTGHLYPGGGFNSGIILGTGVLSLALIKKYEDIEEIFEKSRIEEIKVLIPLFIIVYAIIGKLFFGEYFINFFPKFQPGSIFSGGSAVMLNSFIAFEVFGGSWTILYQFIKHRGLL
ncbi:multisubunit sodium/proton antiporter, MrpB subunit [Marinitoga hydrogenitolerans DSM 16785]|uniref:Multisubunit sodium/proton antiporter, MrpB subunit n=1 Tax=Marinitoga hydrogenitolerans (strain DSM 16785 / JCM 12826 / AT1271) TaxID=1122195 RepID=A0A1M4SLT8_MARH1|nr:hydrogen gas-evolving membrane-bound hydrogenase subunit E [Marinitoga hydrogenitolerans]SHE33203.1 multisubunit sodium/proton antiporter, MrpB subunit [Marinitoga hydrogenitolerans DSM 16785]